MRRKKKADLVAGDNLQPKSNLHSGAKRSLAAIFLFALAAIALLGFFESAGALGQYLNDIIGTVFGVGKWLMPLVLVTAGIVLLYRESVAFYVIKIFGLVLAFWSALGFFHIYIDPKTMESVAAAGQGGGYLGYWMASLMLQLAGPIAGSILLFTILSSGIILAFNFSIVDFFGNIFRRRETDDAAEAGKDDVSEEKPAETVDESEKTEAVGKDAKSSSEGDESDKKESKSLFSPFRKRSLVAEENLYFEGDEKPEKAASNGKWRLPPVDLLEPSVGQGHGGNVEKNAEIIRNTLGHFGIEVELGETQTGPTITQYTFRPAEGVKLSRITSLSNDLALALAAHPIRIEAPIPGKSLIGIEVPNKNVATVRMKELMQDQQFRKNKADLLLALGQDVKGEFIYEDLGKMPHLMVAGSTGSGKSVCINTIILSMLYKNSPEDLKMIFVDPKRVELSLYNGIPHLLTDVIVENNKVLNALKWAVSEMERRYAMLQETGSRDLASFNQKAAGGYKKKSVNEETGEVTEEVVKKLPYIVIIIDELADLMASHGKEVEAAIIRLAQMARAVGIHLIISTQRPSVEVLTGLIKANITTRIAFKVATQIDSRTILDGSGAEKLLGNGDMLFVSSSSKGLRRLQGVFVSESEVKRVVKFIKAQKQETEEEIGETIATASAPTAAAEPAKLDLDHVGGNDDPDDSLYEEAKKVVIESGRASSSLLQRRLRVGYARAARLVDLLEERGVVGPGEGAKPREVFAKAGTPEYDDSAQDQQVREKWQF